MYKTHKKTFRVCPIFIYQEALMHKTAKYPFNQKKGTLEDSFQLQLTFALLGGSKPSSMGTTLYSG